MKFSLPVLVAALSTLAMAVPTTPQPIVARGAASAITIPYSAGFNLGANAADGKCKTVAQWQQEFQKIKSWSAGPKATFNTIKLFSTSDCDALANAVPAALAAGVKLWVGVWNFDDAKFGREKAALMSQLGKTGDHTKWLAGINVGSESLYRKEVSAQKLAGQIYDVRGLVHEKYKLTSIPIGTADTWTSWVDNANKDVITACDVVLMNGFPYWQGTKINGGLAKFQEAITNTKNAIKGKPFIVGETGWPSAGPSFGDADASLENTRKYWKDAACWLQKQNMPWFWFSGFDEPNKQSTIEKNFGIAWSGQTSKVTFTC